MYYKLKKLEVKMKNIKTKIRIAGLSVIVILIFSLSVVNINTVATNSEMLSNKKLDGE